MESNVLHFLLGACPTPCPVHNYDMASDIVVFVFVSIVTSKPRQLCKTQANSKCGCSLGDTHAHTCRDYSAFVCS